MFDLIKLKQYWDIIASWSKTNIVYLLVLIVIVILATKSSSSFVLIKPQSGQKIKLEIYDVEIGVDSCEVDNYLQDVVDTVKPIKFCAIHCTASIMMTKPTKKQDWVNFFYNVKYKGAQMVGYNYIVDIDRVIVLRPLNKNSTIEKSELVWGVAGYNSQTVSIAYVGGLVKDPRTKKILNKDTRTPKQKFLMDSLVMEVKKLAPNVIVQGHRDFPAVSKSCPNYDVTK